MFGVTKVSNRHCVVTGCKKTATTVIGDTKYKYNLKNLFLCDEHLEQLHNTLQNQFTDRNNVIDEQNTECNMKGQDITKQYIKLLYDSNVMLSKAKLEEFCKDNGITVEEGSMKKYMEAIFPELKED